MVDLRRGEDISQAVALKEAEYAIKQVENTIKKFQIDKEAILNQKERIEIDLMKKDADIQNMEHMIEVKKKEIEGIKSRMYLDSQPKPE